MALIEKRQRAVFFAPTARRHFLTKGGAIAAEARALLTRKYPTERQESDNIGTTNRGWHWSEDERLQHVYRRLVRRLARTALGGRDAAE